MARQKLEIPPGLNGDDTVYGTGQNAWSDANNVRFWRGKPQLIGGWEAMSGTALTGACRGIFPWTDNVGQLNVAFGTSSKLQLLQGGALFDITPSGLAAGAVDGTGGAGYGAGAYSVGTYSQPSTSEYYPRTWSLGPWGQNLMASPRGGTIYQWTNNTGTAAAAVANAPASVQYMLVTPQRQVMALGCNDAGTGVVNPMCIRYSDLEVPTTWAAASNNNAGQINLEGGGRLVAGRVVGASILCWTDNALYQLDYVGAYGQTFHVSLLGKGCGLVGPQAVAVVGQTAIWLSSNGQFYRHDAGGQPQLILCPVRDDMWKNITPGQSDKICAASVNQFGEVWFFYPDVRDGVENSRAVFVSTATSAPPQLQTPSIWPWSRSKLARTCFVDSGPSPYPIGVDTSGTPMWHEKGLSANGGPIPAYLYSAGQYIGTGEQLMMIRGVWPDVQGQVGALTLNIVTAAHPDAVEQTSGGFILSPGLEKQDFRRTGRVVRIEFSSNSGPSSWRLGSPAFDVVPTGQR